MLACYRWKMKKPRNLMVKCLVFNNLLGLTGFFSIQFDNADSDLPSYLYDDSATEEDPEQYEFTAAELEQQKERSRIKLRNEIFNSLLKNATLPNEKPFTYSKKPIPPRDWPYFYKEPNEQLVLHKKMFPIQNEVWPYISDGRSAVLIGNTTNYPKLLYLPPICDAIKVVFKDT